MAKTKNQALISPARFLAGSTVLASDAIAVVEQANWTAAETFPTFFRWDTCFSRPLRPTFGAYPHFRFDIFVPAHLQAIHITATFALVGSTASSRLDVTIDAHTASLSRSSSGVETTTVATSVTGTGHLSCVIQNVWASSSGEDELQVVGIQIRGAPIAATDLLSPANE